MVIFLPPKSYQEFISFAFFKFSKAKNFLTLSKITFWLVKYNPYITPDNYEQMSDEFRKAVKVGESLAVFSKDPQGSLAVSRCTELTRSYFCCNYLASQSALFLIKKLHNGIYNHTKSFI